MALSVFTEKPSHAGSPDRAKGRSVLIVDDSPVDRRIAGGVMQKATGLDVLYAGDGEEALVIIERERPSLVVSDLLMPGLDGLMLVQEVRRLFPQIPVILMTAHGSEEVAMQALRAGAANYVPKRSLARDLVSTIRQILAVASTGRKRQRLLGSVLGWSSHFQLENDPDLIDPMIELLQEDLARMELCDETARMRVGIALQEVLTNALYHGNLEVSSQLRQNDERLFHAEVQRRRSQEPYRDRTIHVRVQLDRHSATYIVSDEGPGFDTSRLDRPVEAEELLCMGGRGLLLIRAFMDEVTYNAKGNEVTLVKHGVATS